MGRIEVWRGIDNRPVSVVPYYVSPDGSFFRTDASWGAFERMLAAARVELSDSALVARLVDLAPAGHRVVLHERHVPEEFRETDWAPRRLEDGSWVAHCINLSEGLWERIRIGPTYSVSLEVVGKGRRFLLR
ncbi:MAG: hypothetical protein IT378_06415 [Sandaracinaceae bacterium]|nr:hypothetical protein [Sandaracinaceae bacterium]